MRCSISAMLLLAIRAATDMATDWRLLDFLRRPPEGPAARSGRSADLIDAVFALGGEDDLVRLLARVKALQEFVETEEGTDLLAGYKRAANILKKEKWNGRGVMATPGSQGFRRPARKTRCAGRGTGDRPGGRRMAEARAHAILPEERALRRLEPPSRKPR